MHCLRCLTEIACVYAGIQNSSQALPTEAQLAEFDAALSSAGIQGEFLPYTAKRGPSKWQQRLHQIQRNETAAVQANDTQKVLKWRAAYQEHCNQPFNHNFHVSVTGRGAADDSTLSRGVLGGARGSTLDSGPAVMEEPMMEEPRLPNYATFNLTSACTITGVATATTSSAATAALTAAEWDGTISYTDLEELLLDASDNGQLGSELMDTINSCGGNSAGFGEPRPSSPPRLSVGFDGPALDECEALDNGAFFNAAPGTTPAATDGCPICLSPATLGPLGSKDVWHQLNPCGHGFHASCIVESLRFSPRCPICRDDPSAVGSSSSNQQQQSAPSSSQPEQQQQQPPEGKTKNMAETSAATTTASSAVPSAGETSAATATSAAPAAAFTTAGSMHHGHRPLSGRPCNGVYARHLFGDAGDFSLMLHEHAAAEGFALSNMPVMLVKCKSCSLNCTNCKVGLNGRNATGCKPTVPCPERTCQKDGVEQHEHRGFFKPIGPITCSQEGYNGTDQCRACQWLEASTGKKSLWGLKKLEGEPRKSPLQRQADKAEVARTKGELFTVPLQKRDDLKTRLDWQTLHAQEKAQRCAAERAREEEVAAATKRARTAERFQAGAEGLSALYQTHLASSLESAQAAEAQAAAATVEAATATVEAAAARVGEARAQAAAQKATERQQAVAATNALLSAQLGVAAADRDEALRSANSYALAKAEAEAAAEAQRQRDRKDREACEAKCERERKVAGQQVASIAERLKTSELRTDSLEKKLKSTLSELAEANLKIKAQQRKLDDSIDKNDISGFTQSLHDLDQNDQIEQKDRTLLEHLAKRLRYKRGGKHGAIDGVMRTVQDLLVDKLCRQDYTLVADILHLACFEKAAAGRSRDKITYFVGLNEHILEYKVAEIYNGELVCSMGDGTRTSMLIEKAVHPVYGRPYLVGEAFPADVRLWPSGPQGGKGMMPMPQTVAKVYEYISLVREKSGDHEMSHEVVTEALNCMSDRTRPMLVYSLFPEPSKGFSSIHNLLYWAKLVQVWHDHSIRGMGFATDSCSTGLGAGTALMMPTAKDVARKVPFLGLNDRDFIYCARWVGGRTMADGSHFDYYLKWYADAPHLARSVRRNAAYDSRCILYNCASNASQQSAAIEVLKELQDMYPRNEARFLTEVVTINKFRDQKGDAAYAMLEDRTIEMLKEKRPRNGAAMILYLTSYNYVLEPWVNPEMTNPMTITFNSWMGYALCRLQEIYAVDCMGLDKDIYIPSYQVMRTTAAMAHTAVTHCQHLHLNYRHRLDSNWSQGALRGGTTFPLEGFHSESRTGSVSKASAGDCNSTTGKWVELCSKLMRIRANRLKVAMHGWSVRAARNVLRTDKIKTLRRTKGWGVVPDTFEYSLQCGSGGYNPPASFADFCDDLTRAKRAAQDAGLTLWERDNEMAASQMKEKGLWPGRWDEEGGGRWQSAAGQRLANVNLVISASSSRPVATALATTPAGAVTIKLAVLSGVAQVARPSGPDGVEAMLDQSMHAKMQQADRDAAAARAKMAAHLRKEHGVAEHELEADLTRGERTGKEASQLSVSEMAAHALAEHESLKVLLTVAHGKVVDELGQDVTGLLKGSKLKDSEGRHQNTEMVINACQARERVSRDRGRRFMVFLTDEQRAAAIKAGHDCCRNSLLVIRVGLMKVALGRVIRLMLLSGKGSGGNAALPKSFKLEPGSDKQAFVLELLYPEAVHMPVGEDGEGADMLRFRSSGRMLPHCSATKVLRQVPGTSLHPLKDTVYAVMAADEAIAFRHDPKAGGLKPWATLEHLIGARPLEQDLQLPDNTVCFNCHNGWADEASGPLLQCKGQCNRAFHVACHAHFPLDTQICGRCSGTDADICAICDHEWSDPSKDSDYYTGEMVGCDGGCERWFHQACHVPFIADATVKSTKKWKCADCVAGRKAAPPAVPATANDAAATADATTADNIMSDVVRAPAAAVQPTLPADALPATAHVAPPLCPSTMEGVELTLVRGQTGYGFRLAVTNHVEHVAEGGAAAYAGLRVQDLIVMANGKRLILGEPWAFQGQREGTQLTLLCHRKLSHTEAGQGRQRTPVQRLGMRTWDGVRTGDAPRTHVQRMVGRFESGTAESL